MLKTGKAYLESIRDGRVIDLADERVELREAMSYEEDGERYSMYFLRPRSRDDLMRRTRAHEVIADFGCGVLGRSPDAGSVTGMTMKPEILDQKGGHKEQLLRIWQELRREDEFLVYAGFISLPVSPGTRSASPHHPARCGR